MFPTQILSRQSQVTEASASANYSSVHHHDYLAFYHERARIEYFVYTRVSTCTGRQSERCPQIAYQAVPTQKVTTDFEKADHYWSACERISQGSSICDIATKV